MAEELRKKLEIIRLRKWQARARSPMAYERNLVRAAQELERLRIATGVSRECIERALTFFKQAMDKELTRGRSIGVMAAAALYMACRMLNSPLPLDELARSAGIEGGEIIRYYKLLTGGLNVKLPTSDPTLYLSRIAERLKLSDDIVKEAAEILRKAREAGITAGKDPAGLAAAAIYAVVVARGIMTIPQKNIALAANTTEVTIRNRYKELVYNGIVKGYGVRGEYGHYTKT